MPFCLSQLEREKEEKWPENRKGTIQEWEGEEKSKRQQKRVNTAWYIHVWQCHHSMVHTCVASHHSMVYTCVIMSQQQGIHMCDNVTTTWYTHVWQCHHSLVHTCVAMSPQHGMHMCCNVTTVPISGFKKG